MYRQNLDKSSKSRKKVENILDELCEYENVENYRQLAPLLDYNPGAVYKWVERESIPVDKLSEKRPDINKAFLMGKDAPIANKDYLEGKNFTSKEGAEINRQMKKYFSSTDKVGRDSPMEKILLAFRYQLKSQKSQTKTMLHYLDMILGLKGDDSEKKG